MPYTAEQFIATNQANAEVLQNLSTRILSGFEKLVELNLATSKATVTESFSHLQAVMDAKDPQQLLALQAGLFQPLTEKSASYSRHVNNIAAETGAEFTKAFSALVENVAANAPAGTESAVAAFKSAVSAGQKAVELAESNLAAVTKQALSAATPASAKH